MMDGASAVTDCPDVIVIWSKDDKFIHSLPAIPPEFVMFTPRKKARTRMNFNNIELLATDIIQHFGDERNIQFSVKELTETTNDDIKRIYDVCNIFEATGLVSKIKKDIFYWHGVQSKSFLETLSSLRNVVETQDFNSLFYNQEEGQEIRITLQILTEKMLMLLMLSDEGLNKNQIFSFIYNDPSCSRDSGLMRIAKVLKILSSIGLVYSPDVNDWGQKKILEKANFFYSGPDTNSSHLNEDITDFVDVDDTAEAVANIIENDHVSEPDFSYCITIDEDPDEYKDDTYENKIVDLEDMLNTIKYDDEPVLYKACDESIHIKDEIMDEY